MIREVTMYRIVCDRDGCDNSPQSEEYYAWLDVDIALDELNDRYDWYTAGDVHLCREHAPRCPAEGCGVALHDAEFGRFCEDHAEVGGVPDAD